MLVPHAGGRGLFVHHPGVAAFVRAFLEDPDGGFYTSQDADVPTARATAARASTAFWT